LEAVESYRARSTILQFGGCIAGEYAMCEAMVVSVEADLHLAVVELREDDGTRTWSRPVPLIDVTFYLSMMGEQDFNEWAGYPFHMVLALRYNDETTLMFAEWSRNRDCDFPVT
jgi:hypothetical protein